MVNQFQFFSVTMVTDCPNCHLAIPVKSTSDQLLCYHCKSTFVSGWEKNGPLYRNLILHLENSIIQSKSAASDTVLKVDVSLLESLPCDNCKADLDVEEIEHDNLLCKKCHHHSTIESFKVFGGVQWKVSGSTSITDEYHTFSLGCVSCGASLSINTEVRMQTCEFCQSETLIPDAMWQRLHPELFISPFYLVVKNVQELEALALISKDQEELNILSDHFYSKIREAVASNPSINEELARKLFKDVNGKVLLALKSNPRFHEWFQLEVFMDQEEAKKFGAEFPMETNPNLEEREMLELAKQKMPKRLAALSYNPSISQAVIKQIIRQKVELASVALSKRMDLTQDVIRLLIGSGFEEVSRTLAMNKALPEPTIKLLASSNDKIVLENLLNNTTIPDAVKFEVRQRIKLLGG